MIEKYKLWSENDIEKLKELYPDNSNKDISIILQKTFNQIIGMSYKLRLKKSKLHRSRMSIIQNSQNLKSIEKFIKQSNNTHEIGEYDYSESIYMGAHKPIDIKHNRCGRIFTQKANVHVRSGGCRYCYGPTANSVESFTIKAKLKYGDLNNYDGVYYKNAKTKVKIRCNLHNIIFDQTPDLHLRRNTGCSQCSRQNRKQRINVWKPEDSDILRKLYPTSSNQTLSTLLHKSKSTIATRANILRLKKCQSYLTNMRREVNLKLRGRYFNYEKIIDISKKFKSIQEFRKLDTAAYNFAKKNGYLEAACSHMLKSRMSAPQLMLQTITDGILNKKSLYNTRQIITPYEIDVYYPDLKLAFEYQGKHWHGSDNKRDAIKLERMKELNINLIYIMENNKNYESDIKTQLIGNLEYINKICNTTIMPNDILNFNIENIYEKIHNKQALFEIANQYTSYKKFRKIEKSVCYKLDFMGWLKPATDHMIDKKKNLTMEMVINTIKKYCVLNDLYKNDRSTYEYIKRNKLYHMISHLKRRRNLVNFTLDDVKSKINEYVIKRDFADNNRRMYNYLRRRRLTYLLSGLKNLRENQCVSVSVASR